MTLNEIGIIGHGRNAYRKPNKICDEIIDENTEHTKPLGFILTEKEKTLPIIYWISKIHKNPIGARFINSSKLLSIFS